MYLDLTIDYSFILQGRFRSLGYMCTYALNKISSRWEINSFNFIPQFSIGHHIMQKKDDCIMSFLIFVPGHSQVFFFVLMQVFLTYLVYEKQHKLRLMMKMHGLGDRPYWLISYAYFLALSVVYMFLFVVFGTIIGKNTRKVLLWT